MSHGKYEPPQNSTRLLQQPPKCTPQIQRAQAVKRKPAAFKATRAPSTPLDETRQDNSIGRLLASKACVFTLYAKIQRKLFKLRWQISVKIFGHDEEFRKIK